jgi:hypothetical protein
MSVTEVDALRLRYERTLRGQVDVFLQHLQVCKTALRGATSQSATVVHACMYVCVLYCCRNISLYMYILVLFDIRLLF